MPCTATRSIALLGIVAALVPALACRRKMTDDATASSGLLASECDEILSRAGESVGSATRAANPPGKKSCEKDTDCMEARPASCVAFCFGHGIPQGAAPAFASAM